MALPILRAAGLAPGSVRIIVVKDPELNAFVTGRNTIFLHSGLLMRLKTVPMVQSVIAHEAAHIAAGHHISRQGAGRGSMATTALGVVLGALAASAGAEEAGMTLALGGAHVGRRNFLSHSRADEAAADQSAVRYLAKAGIDPKAAIQTMEIFSGQELLPNARVDPYVRTHPLWSQRIRLLENAVMSTRVSKTKTDPNLPYWNRGNSKAKGNDELSVYRQAIAAHRRSQKDAMALVDRLIAHRPSDPFYHELKGQFLYEQGKAAPAIASYRQAFKRLPKNTLIAAGLARALLATERSADTKEALRLLEKAQTRDPANPRLLQALALAYGRTGQTGKAALVTANRFALSGRLKDAGVQARRAAALLPEGTPGWRQAQDIIAAAGRLKK